MGVFSGTRGLTFMSPQIEVSGVSPSSPRDARERARELQERARELEVRVREATAEGMGRVFYLGGRPRLGANTQSLGDQLAEYFGVEGGVLVTSVHEDTPAAAGGLRAGDVIVGLGDEDIDDPGDLREALAEVEAGGGGGRIVRDGAEQTLTVELEDRERPSRWRRGVDGLDG